MAEERRYGRDEAAQIFEAAARDEAGGRQRSLSSASEDGLTLAELQAIGDEVGIPPQRIAEAAKALRAGGEVLPRKSIARIPYAVRYVSDLPRAPTDEEWDILLGDFRETFAARGKDLSSGRMRHWANSNLHVYIEPAEGGYRLRMSTRKGDASAVTAVAVWGVLMGVFMTVGGFVVPGGITDGLIFFLVAFAAIVFNAVRLPAWAATREEQMAALGERTRALLAADISEAGQRPTY